MATTMAMAMTAAMTKEQLKARLAATIIGPTARLTDSEALERVEELRLRSHATYTRRYISESVSSTRTNVPATDAKHRRPDFVLFARDWQRYMLRDGGCPVD